MLQGSLYQYDFYAICARHWGVSRKEAKDRLIRFAYKAKPYQVFMQETEDIMDFIHPDARAEILFYKGIVVGDN